MMMIEPFDQPHVAAADKPAEKPDSEAMNVKQWQAQEKAICFRDLPARLQSERVHRERIVREYGPLGRTRRAGCVYDRSRRVAVIHQPVPCVRMPLRFA